MKKQIQSLQKTSASKRTRLLFASCIILGMLITVTLWSMSERTHKNLDLRKIFPKETSVSQAEDNDFPEHIATMVEEIHDGDALLLDVREQDEWDEGHLELATLVPLSKLKKGYDPKLGAEDKKVYIHCRTRNRVQVAKPLLEELGYKHVVILTEGFAGLRDIGLVEASLEENVN